MMINNVHSGAMVGLLSISVFLIATGNSKSDCSLSSADPGDASDVVSDVTGGSDMDSPQPDAAADAKPEELEVAIEPELGVCKVKAVHPVTCMCTVKQKCSDGKYWTTDSCDEVTGECTYIDPYTCPTSQGCDDGNACTIDCDDPLTGQCVHLGKNCDDSDVCTEDSCDFVSGECKHSGPNDMYGGCGEFLSLCLENTCDPVKMLCGVKPKCDDGNLCTADSCDEGTGTCSFVPGPDCVACTKNGDCDDSVPCTQDYCAKELGICYNLPLVCNDGDCNTNDFCDPDDGQCVFKPKPAGWCGGSG
jgi:hypothetical protein